MCLSQIFKPKIITTTTIEEIIRVNSAGMNDREKSEYASRIDKIVFEELLKINIHLMPVDAGAWLTVARSQYPTLTLIEVPDITLSTVTQDELQVVLSRDWTNLIAYIAEMFDCDDFSALLTARLAKYYSITAVREVWGQTSGGYHAFCLGVLYDGNKLIARLIEPQTDAIFIKTGPLGDYFPEKTK